MIQFEQGFLDFHIDLFDETNTAASTAVMVFRRNFLEPNTIALDMGNRGCLYITQDINIYTYSGLGFKESLLAGRYLAYRATREGLPIQTRYNIGQYHIPGTGYTIDGWITPCLKYPQGHGIEIKVFTIIINQLYTFKFI